MTVTDDTLFDMMMREVRIGVDRDLRATRAPLDPCANSREFVDRYKLKVDGQRYDWTKYPHQVDWFEDDHPAMAAMAGAQTGKTARMFAGLSRLALIYYGRLLGVYYPDNIIAGAFSRTRIAPFFRSNEELAKHFGHDVDGEPAADAVHTRKFGASTLFFLSIKGRSTTEGLPMSVVMFDEVRRMPMADMQRAEQRYAAQTDYVDWKVSTAGLPDTNIHKYFKAGDQRYFHTACACPDGVVLSTTFPHCIADLRKATPELLRKVEHVFARAGIPYLGLGDPRQAEQYKKYHAAYMCPKCGTFLPNPRDGWWEQHNPGQWVHSWQQPQLLSPSFPGPRAWSVYSGADASAESIDIGEMYRSMLGLPWVDPNASPITEDLLRAATRERMTWAASMGQRWREENLNAVSMGVDVQQGYLVVCIVQLSANHCFQPIHLEIVHKRDSPNGDHWKELSRIMIRFKVRTCIIDAQPEFDAAQAFAIAHQGKVWLCYYSDTKTGIMIDWKDRKKPPAGDKSRQSVGQKYRVVMQRTKTLQWSLGLWARHRVETPPIGLLVQELPKHAGKPNFTSDLRIGDWEPVDMLREVLWWHLKSVIFEKEKVGDEEKGRTDEYVMKAFHMGCDPHMAHAWNYACAALSRIAQAAAPIDEGTTDEPEVISG